MWTALEAGCVTPPVRLNLLKPRPEAAIAPRVQALPCARLDKTPALAALASMVRLVKNPMCALVRAVRKSLALHV